MDIFLFIRVSTKQNVQAALRSIKTSDNGPMAKAMSPKITSISLKDYLRELRF